MPGNGLPLLGDLIAQRVADASRSVAPFAKVPTGKAIDQLLEARQEPALILVDGLNEAAHLPGFITTWIPNAIAWCRQHRAKLICTSRREIWPSIVNAIDDPDEALFVGASNVADVRSLPHCVTMSAFSKAEEDTALASYGLPAHMKRMLQHEPMLYRIAARIGLSNPDATVGRFKLFDTYVDLSLAELLPRLQLGSTRSLRMILATMAGRIDASDGAPLMWSAAREIAGSDAVLDGLVGSGLLIAFGDRVRCRFDGVAEALVPAGLDPSSMFDPSSLADARDRRRQANCLLRLEADGSDSEFTIAASRLVAALRSLGDLDPEQDWGSFQLYWTALEIAQSLPAARSDLIDSIYGSFCDIPKFFAIGVLHFLLMRDLEQSRLLLLRRAELLLRIAPWGHSYPVRTGAWLETRDGPIEGERTFINTSYDLVGVLYRTYWEDPAQIEPLLFNALDDERLLDQLHPGYERDRVTVGRMALDILALRIDRDAERYLAQGLKMGTPGGIALTRCAVEKQPRIALAYLMPLLLPRPPSEEILALVRRCISLLGVAGSASVSHVVRRIAPSNDAIGLQVVEILLLLDPEDAEAWERMVTLFRNRVDGSSLRRYPEDRFAEALAVAEDWPERALSRLDWDKDLSHEDAIFKTIVGWSETGKITSNDFASFVLSRIQRMNYERDKFYEGWLAQASKLIAMPDSKFRVDVIRDVAATPFEELSPIRRHLDELLLATELSPAEADFYARLMLTSTRWASAGWVGRFARMRAAMPFMTDASALFDLSKSEADMTAMMTFWKGMRDDEQSIVSTESIRLAADGNVVTEIFTFDRCMAYLESRSAAAGKES